MLSPCFRQASGRGGNAQNATPQHQNHGNQSLHSKTFFFFFGQVQDRDMEKCIIFYQKKNMQI